MNYGISITKISHKESNELLSKDLSNLNKQEKPLASQRFVAEIFACNLSKTLPVQYRTILKITWGANRIFVKDRGR